MKELDLFLSEYNRQAEEKFCREFSKYSEVVLKFENVGRLAYTDCESIVCNPQFEDLYQNKAALTKTEDWLHLPHHLADNVWDALKMFTRFLEIHECLHILYTDFNINFYNNPLCKGNKNKAIVLHEIHNIIEDAYIEAAGVSVYDNIEIYLRFGNYLLCQDEEDITESIRQQCRTQEEYDYHSYMEYMLTELMYPFAKKPDVSAKVMGYIQKTMKLFIEGSKQPSPKRRFMYVEKIFRIIEPLIPDDKKVRLIPGRQNLIDPFTHLYGRRNISQKPQYQEISRRLYSNVDGGKLENEDDILEQMTEEYRAVLLEFGSEMAQSQRNREQEDATIFVRPENWDLDTAVVHKGIHIKETKYGSNLQLADKYRKMLKDNRSIINTYISRLSLLLQGSVDTVDYRQPVGQGISSKHFADPKRRYWYRKNKGIDIPQLSIMFLTDGSGSMSSRLPKIKRTTIIMHEVLHSQNIEHCFVEHRASFGEPEVSTNILMGIGSDENLRYNLLKAKSDDNTRDGLALLWAERYLLSNATTDNRIIIILSDGYPEHSYDGYFPPVSTEDTRNTVRKIQKRGTKVIAIALDDYDELTTYTNLKDIYPQTISCNDLDRLPGQLLRIISKELEG